MTRRFRTPTGEVVAVDAVDLTVHAGALTVIAGPSGSGKSTLLGLLACLDRPDSGVVEVGGFDVAALSRRARRRLRRTLIGVLLPQPSDNLFDRLDATANVRWSARRRGAAPTAAEVAEQFAVLELSACRGKRVRELSGGEQQRVALLCALAGDPLLVVCDEPTASLDQASAALVVAAMRRVADRGATVLVATHDPDVIAAADVVVHLDHGRRSAP